jgi:Pentapeptide repeats (8 copies)
MSTREQSQSSNATTYPTVTVEPNGGISEQPQQSIVELNPTVTVEPNGGISEQPQQSIVELNPTVTVEPNGETTVEMSKVGKIRSFFDEKTKNHKADKLSQAYISRSFTEIQAAEYELSLGDLHLMFQAYCENPEFTPSLEIPKDSWKLLDLKVRKEWNIVNDNKLADIILLSLKKLAKSLLVGGAGLSALLTFAQFVSGLKGVERQKYLQAWQVVNTAQGQTGNGGRTEALEYLNKESNFFYTPKCKEDNSCLVGVKIQGANLKKVNLEGADLSSSELRGTNFEGADLRGVTFKGAHLEDVVFTGAKVDKATFVNAIFCRTTMADGQTQGTNCSNAKIK